MSKIINNIKSFTRAVKDGNLLRVTSEGVFYVTHHFTAKFLHAIGVDKGLWIKVSIAFREVLRELEKVPINFNLCNFRALQELDFNYFIEAGNEILKKLENSSDPKAKDEVAFLKRDLLALLYRLEMVNGGLSPLEEACSHRYRQLAALAEPWKANCVVTRERFLTSEDKRVLEQACCYEHFIDLVLEFEYLQEEFFKWVLRDRISLKPFIEYPALQQRVIDYDLNGRIGTKGGNLLKVTKTPNAEGLLQKIVTLPFEGKDVDILDDRKLVVFRGNYALTIKEVFEDFRNKRYGDSNLEFMAEGIVNWNAFYWGWWDADKGDYQFVDLDDPEWWKQLPVYEVLTLKQAREKFGTHLDGRQWNLAAISTRETATLDFEGAHSYTSIAIPAEDGRYVVYPFGKYATKFAATAFKILFSIGQTSEATVAFPDENVYYTHRQRSRYSFALTEEQGLQYLESVKRDMLLSKAGNFVYQIESENCAKWAHHKIEEIVGPHRIPNIFQMYFLDQEPRGFLIPIFNWIRSIPQRWQIPVTLFAHFLLSGYKGVWIWQEGKRVWKSLTHHAFWEDTVIYQPAMLLRQQELGIIGRSVRQGVTFNKSHIEKSFHGLLHKMAIFGEFVMRKTSDAMKFLDGLFEGNSHFRMAFSGAAGLLLSQSGFSELELEAQESSNE